MVATTLEQFPLPPPKISITNPSNDSSPELKQFKPTSAARDSAYYSGISKNRSRQKVTPVEAEFGWGGSARHFRKSRVTPTPLRPESYGLLPSLSFSPTPAPTPPSPIVGDDSSILESSFEDSDDMTSATNHKNRTSPSGPARMPILPKGHLLLVLPNGGAASSRSWPWLRLG